MAREKKLSEAGKKTRFTTDNQPSNESKSNGQIERSRKNNIICTARTLFESAGILDKVIENISEEVQNGNNRNAIEMLKIIKEPETQNIKLDGGVEVQKVFIDEKVKKKTDKHIDDFING